MVTAGLVSSYDAAMKIKAMSIRLPEDLYEKLRRAAFDQHTPMNGIIIDGIELKLAALAAAEPAQEASR
jgi:hypothetical protein